MPSSDVANSTGSVLVGYFGEGANDALALGALLARGHDVALTAVCVYQRDEPIYAYLDSYQDELRRQAESYLDKAPEELVSGLEFQRRAVAAFSSAEGLYHAANSVNATVVVVGSTHRGPVGRVLRGSTADNLLHGSSCPVAVAPRDFATHAPEEARVIGVALNGSPEAEIALQYAQKLATVAGAELRLIAITEYPPLTGFGMGGEDLVDPAMLKTAKEHYREYLDTQLEVLGGTNATSRLLEGDAATALVQEAGELDLLVLGSRRFGPIHRVLLGSVSSRVSRLAPCPVLIAPRGVDASEQVNDEANASMTSST